jgi:hypothetical protein
LPFEVDVIPPLTERAVFAVRSFAADRFPDRLADPLLAFFFIVFTPRGEGHRCGSSDSVIIANVSAR